MLHLRWTDHGPCLYLVHKTATQKRPLILRVGWGFDADLPLRPWIAAHLMTTPKGWHDTCIAWCGFYVGWAR